MVIVMRPGATEESVDEIRERIEAAGGRTHVSRHTGQAVIGCLGEEGALPILETLDLPEIESISPVPVPYPLASRHLKPQASVVPLGERAAAGAAHWWSPR